MGQSHEAPGGETLWQRELHSHMTILVRRQLGIEEGGFVQVLAHLHLRLLFALSFFGVVTNFFCILLSGIGHRHSRPHHGFGHDSFVVQHVTSACCRFEHTGTTMTIG